MERTEAELIEIYGERAGIREFDANLTKAEAESLAYQDWRKIVGPKVPAPKQIQELVTKARKELARANATGL
jgi:hypothetical protein